MYKHLSKKIIIIVNLMLGSIPISSVYSIRFSPPIKGSAQDWKNDEPKKIAFLFLTIGDIYHETFWKQFFEGHQEQYSIYVHSKNPLTSPYFKPYELEHKVATTWEHTTRAQIALLRAAHCNRQNYKFIFVSESCIPIQTFDYLYKTLTENPQSNFMFWKNQYKGSRRSLSKLHAQYRYINPQWIILNRKHATLMIYDRAYLPIIEQYPCDNEHYPSSFLASQKELGSVINTQTTLDDWKRAEDGSHPYTFKDIETNQYDLEMILKAHRDGLFFARKFSKDCDLSPLVSLITHHVKVQETHQEK